MSEGEEPTVDSLRLLLQRLLPESVFKSWRTCDVENLFNKHFDSEKTLKQADEIALQGGPGEPLAILLIRGLLTAVNPDGLQQSGGYTI